jgi:hypothetical protein
MLRFSLYPTYSPVAVSGKEICIEGIIILEEEFNRYISLQMPP